MTQEIMNIEAQIYNESESSRMGMIESRLNRLEVQMGDSNRWADRWAKEQVILGMVIQDLKKNLLSYDEIEQIRNFIKEFRTFMEE